MYWYIYVVHLIVVCIVVSVLVCVRLLCVLVLHCTSICTGIMYRYISVYDQTLHLSQFITYLYVSPRHNLQHTSHVMICWWNSMLPNAPKIITYLLFLYLFLPFLGFFIISPTSSFFQLLNVNSVVTVVLILVVDILLLLLFLLFLLFVMIFLILVANCIRSIHHTQKCVLLLHSVLCIVLPPKFVCYYHTQYYLLFLQPAICIITSPRFLYYYRTWYSPHIVQILQIVCIVLKKVETSVPPFLLAKKDVC